MEYFCNYDVLKKDGTKCSIRSAACFSAHYGSIKHISKIRVYFAKEKQPDNRDYVKYLGESAVEKYIAYLNRMGMRCRLFKNISFQSKLSGKYIPGKGWKEGDDYDVKGYAIDIYCNKNSDFTNLLLLNAVRFIYEEDMHKTVSLFLRYCASRSNISLIDRFILALKGVGEVNNTNHYPVEETTFPVLRSVKDHKKHVFSTNGVVSVNNSWSGKKEVNLYVFEEFAKFAQNKKNTLKEIHNKYKSYFK